MYPICSSCSRTRQEEYTARQVGLQLPPHTVPFAAHLHHQDPRRRHLSRCGMGSLVLYKDPKGRQDHLANLLRSLAHLILQQRLD